ncbi:MAG: hypothetical protein PF518_07030, partial [Spirochaetaceae bacterium]|jgi:hypothetical protein|nr:hypothetical protein [Spirochaetaceae bacterium]
MVKSNEEKFNLEVSGNNNFRKSFYKLDSVEDKKRYILEAGYEFEYFEFEESINNLKTRCSTEEDAIKLDELLLWWQILMPYDETVTSATVCTPAECAKCSSCG